ATTLKERFVGRSGSGLASQMLRVDTETTEPLAVEIEQQLIARIAAAMPTQDAVLISDYDKGICTPNCIRATIDMARQRGIPVLVDPGRGRDLTLYRNATVIKPNRSETELAVHQRINSPAMALRAGSALCQQYGFDMAVITLDADGMALTNVSGAGQIFPTKARSVFDITGAGDMVLSVLGLGFASGLPADVNVQLANAAAGLEVDRTGVTPLTRNEIRAELTHHQFSSRRKVGDLDQIARQTEEYRRRGKRVVLTNGCFDLLHVGHVTYLEEAAAAGDILIVAINSDRSVRELKGPERPVIAEFDRAGMLAALSCVDHVLVFDEPTPHRLLEEIRPDILIKGGTYRVDEVVGREVVEAYGGEVQVAGVVPGISTTQILHNVHSRTLQRPDDAALPQRKAG
ncbi:MAG: D-glycero-beta-D-manno-heptose 1-phosphate adenylyltransferase, partial [Planctomycetales bacterium]|nr:D-glycero-beta-D-manno-heptose 1-phosphate adenylyltransferase [Planctomycetales bacterium]